MLYGQSPPRTPYGDQDFIKEEWNDQQPPPPLQRMPPTMAGRPLVPPHQQPSYADQYQNPPGQAAYSSAAQPIQSQALVLEQIKSTKLTPEDQIFISGWRRDSFFYRVLPMAAVGNGIYYLYSKKKNLPLKSTRFFVVTVTAFFAGKWSYKNELKRRLEASPSTTPFIMALRELTGAQMMAGMGEFSSDTMGGQEYMSGFGESNAPLVPPLPTTTVNSAYTRPPGGAPVYTQQLHQSYEPDLSLSSSPPFSPDGTSKPTMTSYEELRARNRGLVQR